MIVNTLSQSPDSDELLSDEEQQHLRHLLAIHKTNLHHLETQAALAGAATVSVFILNQISEEQEQVATLETQLRRLDELRSSSSTPASKDAPTVSPNPLPVQPTPLVGREREVAEIRALLQRPDIRIVTLTGPGGIGKTRLGLQVATELSETFTDGVAFIDLAPITNSALVPAAIIQALNLKECGEDRLKTMLKDQRLLLILDNFEQVIDAAPFVADLLASAQFLKILVTSREALQIGFEHRFPVSSLAVPDVSLLPSIDKTARTPVAVPDDVLPILTDSPSVMLFAQRAQMVKQQFHLDSLNIQPVAEICIRLEGLPLAIELAAARINIMTPIEMLVHLDKRLRLLVKGNRNQPTRQQTMRAAIDWSYEPLREDERTLFTRIAVLTGGGTPEAVFAICGQLDATLPANQVGAASSLPIDPDPLDLLDLLDTLQPLVDKNLLQKSEESDGSSRFGMLEIIREYALERLNERGESEVLRQRHAEYYTTLAEIAEPELNGPQQAAWLKRLDTDHANVRAALTWAVEHNDAETVLRLSGTIWRFWYTCGYLSEGRRWLDQALAAVASNNAVVPPILRAKAFNGAAVLAIAQGEQQQAQGFFEASLAIFRELNDRRGIATALNNLGNLAQVQEDNQQATTLFEESLAMFRDLGDHLNIARLLNNLAVLAHDQNDDLLARSLHDESLALHRAMSNEYGTAASLVNLAEIDLSSGVLAQAFARYQESLAIFRELGDKEGIPRCLEGLAQTVAKQGAIELAARWWGAANKLRVTLGAPLSYAELARNERAVTAARDQIDYAAFVSAEAAGRKTPLSQIIAEALVRTNS